MARSSLAADVGGGMPARFIWALVLLAAVFCMHGLQCVTTHSSGSHGAPTATSQSPMDRPAAERDSTESVSAESVSAESVSIELVGAAPASTAITTSSSDVAPHDGKPMHRPPVHAAGLWAVCLAVLLAGVALLGASVLLRAAALPLLRGSPGRRSGPPRGLRLPRPPDLSVLCLLRI